MEEASGETNQTPKENSRDTGEVAGDQVTVGAEVNHDVDKTLYDAEEFLSNFAGLRDENEQLKQANHELQLQLEKARQDIEQLQLDKQTLEAQLLQEREQSKEELWKVRSEFQALQDERLQWKEKYLNVCMKAANQPTGLGEGSTSSGNKSKGLKRKQGSMSNLNESNSDDFYSNLSSTFGLNDQDDQQPVVKLSSVSTFESSSALQEHSNGQIKFQFRCSQCNFIFSDQRWLDLHKKQTHTKRNFICTECDKNYLSQKTLSRHIRYDHQNPGLYVCTVCNRKFNRKDMLKKHTEGHSENKEFKCSHCEKCFQTKSSLSAHVNGVHSDKRLYICDFCGMRTSWKSTFTEHVKLHDGKPRKYHLRKLKKVNKTIDKSGTN